MPIGICADATQSGVLDWIRLREGLGDVRRAKPLTVAQLAADIAVAETTIYRIENVKENPDHKPELPTIEAWLAAAHGPKLSMFIARYEVELPNPLLNRTDEPTNNPPGPVGIPEATHGGGVPEARAAAIALDHLNDTLLTFAHAIGAAVDTLRAGLRDRADADQPDATADVDPPEGGEVPVDVRR